MKSDRQEREARNITRCRTVLRCLGEIENAISGILTDYVMTPTQPQANHKSIPKGLKWNTFQSAVDQAKSFELEVQDLKVSLSKFHPCDTCDQSFSCAQSLKRHRAKCYRLREKRSAAEERRQTKKRRKKYDMKKVEERWTPQESANECAPQESTDECEMTNHCDVTSKCAPQEWVRMEDREPLPPNFVLTDGPMPDPSANDGGDQLRTICISSDPDPKYSMDPTLAGGYRGPLPRLNLEQMIELAEHGWII